MTSKNQISAISIDLTANEKPALRIFLNADGIVERMGNGGPFHDDYNLYTGKIDEGLFQELRSRVPKGLLSSTSHCGSTGRADLDSKFTIIFQMVGSEDIIVQYVYPTGQELPHELCSFMMGAVNLTEPWVRKQKAKAGIKHYEPLGGYEYAREQPPEGYEYRQEQASLSEKAKAKSGTITKDKVIIVGENTIPQNKVDEIDIYDNSKGNIKCIIPSENLILKVGANNVEFQAGEEIHFRYGNGEVWWVYLSKRQSPDEAVIVGENTVPLSKLERIDWYSNGRVESLITSENLKLNVGENNVEFIAGEAIDFHNNGNVRAGLLSKRQTIKVNDQTFTFRQRSTYHDNEADIWFHGNQMIERGSLAKNVSFYQNGKRYETKKNSRIDFNPDGSVKVETTKLSNYKVFILKGLIMMVNEDDTEFFLKSDSTKSKLGRDKFIEFLDSLYKRAESTKRAEDTEIEEVSVQLTYKKYSIIILANEHNGITLTLGYVNGEIEEVHHLNETGKLEFIKGLKECVVANL